MTVPTATRFSRYLTVIFRWLLIAFVVFALANLIGLYITDHILPKVYTATAQIQIVANPQSSDAPFQAELETMESPDFLRPVINDLDLDGAWAKRVYKSQQELLPAAEALAYLHHILKIDVVRGTNIITITAASDEPKEAADIANAIADRYQAARGNEVRQRNSLEPTESPVRIVSHAEPPTVPSKPNKAFNLIVTNVVAGFLSIMAASFVEMIFLFLRAGERTNN
jgi:capsular polysaccharide biosynthesis protein